MSGRRRPLVAGGLVLTALLVGVASLFAVNAMARQTVQDKHTYGFTGSALSIDAALGDVHIVPGKAGEITVARRLTYGLRRPFVEERIDGDTFRVSDRRCTAEVAFDCEVQWLLQVPRDIDVEVTTQTGSITVSGMSNTVKLVSESGEVRALASSGKLVTLRSRTGDVSAQNVSSEQVVATSINGDVSLAFRAPPSLVVGRSETGNVGVILPDGDESYRIEAKSLQDGIRTVTAKDDPDSRRRINVRSTKGDVSVLQNPDREQTAP
jgi:putative adhesin